MIHNIENTDIALNSRLIKQDSLNSILGSNADRKGSANSADSNLLIDSLDISTSATKMYERDLDVRNFTRLAISNPENDSHNALVENLFAKGIVDVFEDSSIVALAGNQALLNDLEL